MKTRHLVLPRSIFRAVRRRRRSSAVLACPPAPHHDRGVPSSISRRCSGGSPRPARAHLLWAPWAVACSGLLACSVLAPSDEELLGSARGPGGTAGAGGGTPGRGNAGTSSSGPDGVVLP